MSGPSATGVIDLRPLFAPTSVAVVGASPRSWIAETVREVADGILGQGFEPTPSFSACAMCDYRIACPAAER